LDVARKTWKHQTHHCDTQTAVYHHSICDNNYEAMGHSDYEDQHINSTIKSQRRGTLLYASDNSKVCDDLTDVSPSRKKRLGT